MRMSQVLARSRSTSAYALMVAIGS